MHTQGVLDSLGILQGTDKSSLGHGYLRHYERILSPFRDEQITLLEIGVARGGSLRTWESYLPNAIIVGIDIQQECVQHAAGRRTVEIGSQADRTFLLTMGTKHHPSIIVDDGSHRADHILLTFQTLYPHLREGGIYIVEDVHFHSGPFADAVRGGAELTPQQFFLQLANLVVCPQENVQFDRSIVNQTDGVEFFYGGIAIKKKPRPEAEPITPRRALVERAAKSEIWGAFSMYLLNNRGDLAEALAAVKSAILLNPMEAGHYHQLSIVLERMGDVPSALVAARDAFKLHPSQPVFPARIRELESRLATS